MRLAKMNVTWLWNVIMSASTDPRMLEIKAGSSLVNGKAVRWKKKEKALNMGEFWRDRASCMEKHDKWN